MIRVRSPRFIAKYRKNHKNRSTASAFSTLTRVPLTAGGAHPHTERFHLLRCIYYGTFPNFRRAGALLLHSFTFPACRCLCRAAQGEYSGILKVSGRSTSCTIINTDLGAASLRLLTRYIGALAYTEDAIICDRPDMCCARTASSVLRAAAR